jgi:hypothetical protein
MLYLSAAHGSLGLEYFTVVQGGYVSCCVDLKWNELPQIRFLVVKHSLC